jgi:hypothetical protein
VWIHMHQKPVQCNIVLLPSYLFAMCFLKFTFVLHFFGVYIPIIFLLFDS